MKDNEIAGTGNSIDFKFRAYDPRIARFKSIDPLAAKYPWSSTYTFAEGDVIRCKDLEGAERLDVNDIQAPANGNPGSATITISLAFQVVTSGGGAVNTRHIDPTAFNGNYQQGNIMLRMTTLPTAAAAPQYLTPQQDILAQRAESGNPEARQALRDANINYYNVQVNYNYSLDAADGHSLEDGLNFVNQDRSGHGLIFNPVVRGDFNRNMPIDLVATAQAHSNAAVNEFRDPTVGAMGTNERPNITGSPINMITTNPRYFGAGGQQFNVLNDHTMSNNTEVLVHEAGHPSARNHVHGTGHYEYDQNGLQSNRTGTVIPSESNTKNILNDASNRSTIR